MKNAYRVMLIGLAVLGVVYASTGPEETTKDVKVKYEPLKIGTFPVFMKVGHYIKLRDVRKIQIKLEQVKCPSGRNNWCYKGCATIKVKANFPAILSASLNKSGGDVDILKEMNLHWENGVNTIQGDKGDWEELKLYLEAWDVEIWKSTVGTVKVGEITIKVKPKDTQLED